jgi:hypothetical protein
MYYSVIGAAKVIPKSVTDLSQFLVNICSGFLGGSRVARWFIFKTKIQIWVNLGKFLRMENAGIFYGHVE